MHINSIKAKINLGKQLIAALLFFVLILPAKTAKAADVMDTILDTLANLTCETQGVGNLLRSEFSHTCIPAPFFTFAIANILSPGLYANTFLRVTMNDDELFPGACKRENRIDFNDQKLSFSMCSNVKLALGRIGALAKTGVAIGKAMFSGKDPWNDIVDAWDLPKSTYHEMFLDKKEGDSGIMVDLGAPPVFPWKVIKENDRMCVATVSFGGYIPIGCKYIKEPYPVSIYADFLDVNAEANGVGELTKLTSLTSCSGAEGCYRRAYNSSKATIVMTGPMIECVKEMIAKLMISSSVCSFDDIKYVLRSNTRTSSALYQFQKGMHLFVTGLLTIYVIFFGFKVILSGDVPPKADLVNFTVKFLFVVYFSVGININTGNSNEIDRLDGMIQWAFPFLLDGMTQLASWIINASPSDLCRFTDVQYPDNLRHLQLWDALDCRIGHYLGLDAMQTMIVDNSSRKHDFSKLDIFSNSIPPYVFLLVPALISGYPQLISLALMYPLLVISVGAFVVNATVVCMISIVVLGVLAPLFVPMYLFNYTRGYFDTWVKLLISFMLQPMVAVVFMTTMMSVYDFGFYGKCKYKYKDFTYSGTDADIKVGDLGSANTAAPDTKGARYFYIDQDWDGSYADEDEVDSCRNSLGFILNNPYQFFFDTGASLVNDAIGEEDKKKFSFLDAVASSPGMFFNMIKVIFEKIKALVLAMLTACLVLYLMYHFSESLAEFTADMTEGVSIGDMAIKPQALYKVGQSMAGAAGGKGDGAKAGGKEGRGRESATDKMAAGKGDGGASDKMSIGKGGDGGAADKMSIDKEGGGAASDKASTEKSAAANIKGDSRGAQETGNEPPESKESSIGTAENKEQDTKESSDDEKLAEAKDEQN